MANTPEFKKMMGERMINSDGFTYGYGRANEYSTTYRHKETTERCRRNDKRSVKQKELRRIWKEENDSN